MGRLKHHKSFIMMGEAGTTESVMASHAGLKWRSFEDSIIIAAGSVENPEVDAMLASQLGRTPGAVRARRAKLKKLGKL